MSPLRGRSYLLPFLSYVVHICVFVCMSLRPVHVGVKSEGVY